VFDSRVTFVVFLIVFASVSLAVSSPSTPQEKSSRTDEQQKLDSQLIFAIRQMRGEAGVPTEEIKLKKDNKGRVLVDVRAPVSKKLLARIRSYGGRVVSTSDRDDSIVAYISLAKLESLAQLKDVRFIMPAAEAITN
jgi:hypothetical protein